MCSSNATLPQPISAALWSVCEILTDEYEGFTESIRMLFELLSDALSFEETHYKLALLI